VTTNTGWGVTTNFSAENLLVINAGKGNLSFNATDTSRGGSRVVLSGKKGVDIQTSEGTISVQSSGGASTSAKIISDTGDVSIGAGGGLTLTNSIINALQGAVKANANGGGITLGAGSITAKGDINLQASNAVSMKGATVSSSAGGFTVNTTDGNIDLTSGNISVNKDINIHTPNGSVMLIGNNVSAISDITSAAGNINITATVNKTYNTGVRFDNVNVSASAGEIHVYGENSGDTTQSWAWEGDLFGGVYFLNSVSFSAHKTTIDAVSSYPVQESTTRRRSSPTALSFSGTSPVTLNISGNAVINASAQGGVGVLFNSRIAPANTTINLRNGAVTWTASTGDAILTTGKNTGAFTFANTYSDNNVYVNLDQADLTLIADASGAVRDKVPGVGAATPIDGDYDVNNGFFFSGNGNVSVTGKSSQGDGIDARVITNKDLNGTLSLQGESDSGVGVTLDGILNAHLVNASISGTSHSGIGVNISALKGKADLGNNEITGISDTSAGVQIIGSNVTVTNGVLTGRSGGAGAGVSLQGGSQYTFSGVNVTGQSVDGAGVSVSGNLAVNDQTTLNGTASGA
ncbi:hypothetical protein G9033_004897, partial [Salmonella enterica]|nr:hypothetical protein [Salmonella enterica]